MQPEGVAARIRLLALLGGLLALAGLGIVIWQSAHGAVLPWTSWALPMLLLTNALVSGLDVARGHPRRAMGFAMVSGGVAIAIIVALRASPR